METKKYLSLERLTEYDALIKAEIDSGDETALADAKTYTDTKTSGLASTSSVNTSISTHNTSTSAHSDIRTLISDLTTKLNNFLDVDDTTTDQLSEVITLINNNKGTLESLTTSKVNISDIVNNLTTNSTSKVLSAAQGVAIQSLIDALEVELDTKAGSSDLTSHTGNTSNPHGVTASQVGAYTKTEIDIKLSNKADSSHGNHVPEIQPANDKVFLRNDNTWATITPANIGAAESGHIHTASEVGAYSKEEINNLELITVEDIDTICNANIVSASEVTY